MLEPRTIITLALTDFWMLATDRVRRLSRQGVNHGIERGYQRHRLSRWLAPDRKSALRALRTKLKRVMPRGFVEAMQYGMISYVVPLSVFPKTYNGQPLTVVSLASQKQHMALYLYGLYGDPKLRAWFERAYTGSGKRLDMGKSCLRFKALDQLALDVVLEAVSKVSVDDLIAMHEAGHGS